MEQFAAPQPPVAAASEGLRAILARMGAVDVAEVGCLLEAVGMPLYVTDATGSLVFNNDAAAALWGARPALGDPHWCDAMHLFRTDGTALPPEQCPMAICLREARAVAPAEVLLQHPDGTRIAILCHPRRILAANGSVLGVIDVLTDVSDLRRAQDDARQAMVAKTRFLAAMAHEFRTPIHAVLGFADLLADVAARGERLDAEHGDWIGELKGAGQHLLGLVDDAISFAQAAASPARAIAAGAGVRLGAIVADGLASAGRAFAARGVGLVPQGPAVEPAAMLDAPAARLVLFGVLREIKFHMPAGSTVTMAWGGGTAAAGAWIELRCPGFDMPADLLEGLDRPFAGTECDTYQRGLEGAGLAVATAAALLRGNGGQFAVAGGHGGLPATFRLTFPAATLADGVAQATPAAPAQPSTAAPAGLDLAGIVAAASDIVIVTTADLDAPGPTIVYVNRAFSEVTGYAPEQVLGRTPRLLQGPGTDRAAMRRIVDNVREGREGHATVMNYARDGHSHWLDIRIVPLRDRNGTIRHYAAIERPIDPPVLRPDAA